MILIDNATQSGLLTMPECIDALERAFGAIDSGQAIYRPKTDVNVPNSSSPTTRRTWAPCRQFTDLRRPTAIGSAIPIDARSTG